MRLWSLALRNLVRNRRRSLLAGGVIGLGFASFALAGGFMAQSLDGLREGTIRGGLGHLQLAGPRGFEPGADATLEHGLAEAPAIERVLREDPDVREVLARIDFVGLVTSGGRSVPFLGTGLDPVPEARAMELAGTLVAGRWLADRHEPGVVLGAGLAAALAVRVDDTVTLLGTTADGVLNAVDATVVAVAAIPIKELDDRFLATSLDLARSLLVSSDRVSRLVVVLDDAADERDVLARVVGALDGAGFDVAGRTWEELALFYRQVRLLYAGIFGFMGAVLVVVVLLGTTNTMMMAATERTREIGTLRALGTRPRSIRRMLVAEAALLAIASCVAGALAALAVRAVLNRSGIVLPPPPGVARGMPLHIEIYGATYLAGAVAMVLTTMLAAYVPARRASRIPIVDALSHV
jgi:putative ABC transport system permease protein